MTVQEWLIPLREEHYEQWGKVLTHGRRPDPKSPSGKSYWYSIDGKTGLHKLPKTELPLYAWERLKEDGQTYVVITEGEKDADAVLNRDYVAVGTATGASGTSIPCDESLKVVLGRTVYLWADNDDAGRNQMDAIADRLFNLGATDVRDIRWNEAPYKGGAADFAGDYAAFVELINSAAPREKPGGDLTALLSDICTLINRFLILAPAQVDTLALWVLHTWTFSVSDTTPYLSISSPEKRSGKTRIFEILELIVREPFKVDGTSSAALFHSIENDRPTLLLDEVDTTFKGDKEVAQAIRQILNAGSRRRGVIARMSGQGSNMEVKKYSVFSPKAFAGIGKKTLPDTVLDRSIPIDVKRKTNNEKTDKLSLRKIYDEVAPLKARIKEWATYNEVAVGQAIDADPEVPETLSDRAADGWEPLIAIAELAGSSWGSRAKHAATTLMKAEDDGSQGVALLRDIHRVFKEQGNPEKITSSDLVTALRSIEESPWGAFDFDARKIAYRLKPYGIEPGTHRFNPKNLKGYRRQQFIDAWRRYTADLDVTALHDESELDSGTEATPVSPDVTDSNSANNQQSELDVNDVTAKPQGRGENPDYPTSYTLDSGDEMRFH
jgi:hypothetical protein